MEKNLNYYRAIQNSIGCSDKADYTRKNTIRRLEQSFENPVDVETFMFWYFGKEIQEQIRLEVVDEKYSDAGGDVLKVTSLLSAPLKVGDVLYRPDLNEYYICKESYKKSRMFYKCALVRCNYWIKWQDSNAKIYEYPVFEINSTQYNSGESGDKTITLGSSQHLVTITADENTILLDHDKRIFWDRNTVKPTVFKITQNDTTAMNYDKGLLKITITEDEYNPQTDSIKDWLCDCIDIPLETNPVKEIGIAYVGQAQIRSGGSSKTFTAETDNLVNWSMDLSAEQNGSIVLSIDGNICKVKCLSNEKLIGSSFILRCTDGINIGEVEINIVGGV